MKPLFVMLAGPNGGGKTTFYETYLSGLGLPFLNADVLARELGMDAYQAADQVAEMRGVLVKRGMGFVSETVFSDPVGEKVGFLKQASSQGFDMQLIYIGIADWKMSVERVEQRVKAGGHDVPLEKLKNRYKRTLLNLKRAISLLPYVTVYDNSSFDEPYRLIATFRQGKLQQQTKGEIPGWARRLFEQ